MSDPSNCGVCGNACPAQEAHATPTCSGGKCGHACSAGFSACPGSICVDFSTDNAHCGNCNTTCTGGKSCSGACVCPAGTTDCNGTCINIHGSDTNNCGACGNQCATGQSCVSGACHCPTGQNLCGTTCTIDTATACGASCSNCGTGWCNAGACVTPTTFAAAGAGAPGTGAESINGMLVSQGTVYWTYTIGPSGSSQPMGVVAGGANLYNGTGKIFGQIAAGGGSLYWITASLGHLFVFSMPTSGATPVGLAQGSMTAIADDGANYYITTGSYINSCANGTTTCQKFVTSSTSNNIVASGTYVYWTEPSTNSVLRCTAGTVCSSPSTVYSPTTSPGGLAVDGTNVYWLDSAGLQQVPVGGGAKVTLAAGATGVGPASNDGAHVYWAGQNNVYRATVGVASSQQTIATSQLGVQNIVVDAASVYWSISTGAIMTIGQ